MDIQSYESARGYVEIAGYFVSTLLLVAACYLTFNSLTDGSRRQGKIASSALYIACGLGAFLIIYLHLKIYVALPMIEPFSGQVIGRFMIPPWVESERVFYWLILVILISALTVRGYPQARRELSITVLIMAAFLVFFENPFIGPLPQFDQMYSSYYQAIITRDTASLEQIMQTMFGKLFFFYNSPYMWVHPPLLFLAYAAFTVSFASHLKVIFRDRARGDSAAGDLMKGVYDNAKLGFFVLTTALLIGYPWALIAWKDLPWWWDPKVNSSMLMWVLYASFLHTNLYLKQGKFVKLTHTSAMLAFAALLFTFFSGYLIPGVHS